MRTGGAGEIEAKRTKLGKREGNKRETEKEKNSKNKKKQRKKKRGGMCAAREQSAG
jgi:hypothetical protein